MMVTGRVSGLAFTLGSDIEEAHVLGVALN
ncbi:MAG: hypothetical protein QG671_2746, partial [Actinomycetota bacterium]|nr:hypothetical protein [Actinomycetota bacterium]